MIPEILLPIDAHDPINRLKADGLVACWLALPDTLGGRQLFDLTGLNHGTLTNFDGSSGWRSGSRTGAPSGACLLTDKTDDYVDCGAGPGFDVTSAWTFSFWWRQVAFTAANLNIETVIGKDVSGARSYAIGFKNSGGNQVLCAQINGTNAGTGNTTLTTDNKWHHAAYTYDGTNVRYYLDGVPDGSAAASSPAVTTTHVRLGAREYVGNTDGHNGYLDDLRIYNRCLSNAEVRELYDNALQGYPGFLRRASILEVVYEAPFVPDGGIVLGGSVSPSLSLAVSGGIVFGGTAALVTDYIVTPSGGIVLGGTSRNDFVETPSGGITLGGSVSLATAFLTAPSGGLALGGSSSPTVSPAPSGGATLGGTVSPIVAVSPSGGLIVSGTAIPSLRVTPSGGLIVGGSVTTLSTYIVTPSGGLSLGGSAPDSVLIGVEYCDQYRSRATERDITIRRRPAKCVREY